MSKIVSESTSFTDADFQWLHHPETHWTQTDDSAPSGDVEGTGGKILEISPNRLIFQPPAYKDFWSKTFYTPLLVKADASAYVQSITSDVEMSMSVDMAYTPCLQFDQAGLMIYIDANHWMKCGIEYCDGSARLSVVVTNHGFSDWSTQPWPSYAVRLKVHKIQQSSSIVIEAAAKDSSEYQFIRIAHLQCSESPSKDWLVGPFYACPTKQRGCVATFEQWRLGPRQASCHDPDLATHDL